VLGDIQSGFKNLTKLLHPDVGAPPQFILQTGDLNSFAYCRHHYIF
jgi:hypothetical protein